MKGGIQNCVMCGKEIKTFLENIGKRGGQKGGRIGYIESKEGILFEHKWFCNECWNEIIGEKVNKPFKMIKKKLPHKKLKVFTRKDRFDIFEEPICAIEVNENIKRVFNNKPLTRPLAMLNKNCEFKAKYNMAFDIINEDKFKEMKREYNKEYNQRPEVKKSHREYSQREDIKQKKKIYSQQPEVKAKMREYAKEYAKRPEVIKARQEYKRNPERRAKKREYEKKRYKIPKFREKKRKYAREWSRRKKEIETNY